MNCASGRSGVAAANAGNNVGSDARNKADVASGNHVLSAGDSHRQVRVGDQTGADAVIGPQESVSATDENLVHGNRQSGPNDATQVVDVGRDERSLFADEHCVAPHDSRLGVDGSEDLDTGTAVRHHDASASSDSG